VAKFSSAVMRVLMMGVLMAIAVPGMAQQAYPSKPIRMVVPFPPGASNDILGRLIGQKLSEAWGQQVLVENRAGGSTVIGADFVAKSAPDGYTLMLTSSTHILTGLLVKTPYDTIKDFTPIATVDSVEHLLAINPSVPANNLREFIAYAKSKPGQLNYASSSIGSTNHLAAALFESLAGVKMQHVPYKGGGPAVADLIGGQVQLMFNSPSSLVPHVKSGKLRGIAVTGEHRLVALPDVPTFAQAGLPGFELKAWHGVLGPAGVPKPIVDKLSAEIAKILVMADTKEKLASQGMEAFVNTPEQFAGLMQRDFTVYGKIIKAANIRIEN